MGNFLGDFVKGSHLQHLPADIRHGVRLHRKIDAFTDSHAIVKSIRATFPSELRRMSGVLIDIYFDHLLSVHWQLYTQQSKQAVLDNFYRQLRMETVQIDGRFEQVRGGLLKHRWLTTYETRKNCLNAFLQIEKRLNMRIIFAEKGYHFVNHNHQVIEQGFLAFYPELIKFVQSDYLK
uniref:acyl carrier protein phosphodiesterase n=1 Tax=Aliiglaciecola lipolytica TaxID=477689 RepID=UPI0002F89575|nr:ACP phosphodiesterase [Aliiglaciecola lipolytica]